MIAIVVAMDKNRAIGAENKIPWRIKSDLIRLSRLTRGNVVILGRKSFDSMVWYYDKSGKRMPGAQYIVVTRNSAYKPARDNAQVAHSVQGAIALAQSLGSTICVIGGGSIFDATLPYADVIYLTEVQTSIKDEVDAYFPELDPTEWREVSREHHRKNEQDQYDTEEIVLERV
nr:Dihydrofolate reductase [uncultured bacterium]